jgi:methanogenic corrinoid protein MtbC1
MPLSQTPTYNLKAVLNETGIGADTLRAWERRYGVPMPQRTPGGHRLYSQRDIYLIKWLLARQAEGLTISRAVKRWHEVTASGEDPLTGAYGMIPQGAAGSNASVDALRQDWLTSCLRFSEADSEQVLNQAFGLYPAETVVAKVIQHGLHEMGELWQRGKASVQQEHFASALAMRRLDALMAAAPLPTRREAIVLACPPGELHSLPLLYLNLLLRRRGRRAIFLGADVPTEHLEETARAVKAALVVLAAQRLTTAAALRDAAGSLAKKDIPVAYGGRAFNKVHELCKQISGEFLGEEVEAAVDQIEELLERPVALKPQSTARQSTGAEAYRGSRAEIEFILQHDLAGQVVPDLDLTIANNYFGGALAAALALGNIEYMAADMDWIKLLVIRPHMPFESPHGYLMAYAAAMRQVMGVAATEMANWLEAYAPSA